MAINPITSDSLTIDFKDIMRIPVGNRVQAASLSPSFLQSMLNALTPIQIAKAFPDYYRRSLPDISNFINASRYFDAGGQANQTGGGEQGYIPDYYDGETKPTGMPRGSELTIEQMKQKLMEKGINVDNTYDLLSQGPVLAGDERLQFIKNMSTDKLLEMGIEKYQNEDGKDLFRLRPVSAEGMTDEQIQTEMKKAASKQEGTYRPAYPLSDVDLSPEVINTIAGEALNNKESIDGVINNMLNRVGVEKGWNNLKDVARAPGQYAGYKAASEEQAEMIKARIREITSGKVPSNIGAATEFRAEYYVKGEGYGKTFEREARKQGYLQPGPGDNIYAETFAAGPYAPRKAEDVEKIKLENAAKINKTFTTEEIKIYREELIKKQREEAKQKAIKSIYDTPSPTSSDYVHAPGDNRTSTNVSINPYNENLPGGKSAMRNKQDIRGLIFHKSPLSLEQLQKGEDARGSSYGYNTAIISKFVDSNGNEITESDWKKLPDSSKSLYTEKPEIHQIRSEDVRPNQMKGSDSGARSDTGREINNTNALGIVTLGKDSPAKQEAAQKYVADLLARGTISEEALYSSYGHGEVQPDEGRASLDPGKSPEGSYMAQSIRQNVETIKKMAEDMKMQKTANSTSANPVPQFALGGNMYGLNEDMTLVETATGKSIAQIGQNEKLEKRGNAIQVTPETKLKADELAEKYDTSSEVETRMNDIEDRITQQQEAVTQISRKPNAPDRVNTSPSEHWREDVKTAERPVSPSFNRAIARSKFFPEGHHYQRGTVSAKSV